MIVKLNGKELRIKLFVRWDGENRTEVSLDEAKEIVKKIKPKATGVLIGKYSSENLMALSQSPSEYNVWYAEKFNHNEPRYLPIRISKDGRVYLQNRRKYGSYFYDDTVDGKILPVKYEVRLLRVFYKENGQHFIDIKLLIVGELQMEKHQIHKLRKVLKTMHKTYLEGLLEVLNL